MFFLGFLRSCGPGPGPGLEALFVSTAARRVSEQPSRTRAYRSLRISKTQGKCKFRASELRKLQANVASEPQNPIVSSAY